MEAGPATGAMSLGKLLYPVYGTGGVTSQCGTLREYVGYTSGLLGGRDVRTVATALAIARCEQHGKKGPHAARFLIRIEKLETPRVLGWRFDEPAALILELYHTILAMRRFREKYGECWWRRVKGACFVRIRPCLATRKLRALLMAKMPEGEEEACALTTFGNATGSRNSSMFLNGPYYPNHVMNCNNETCPGGR